METLVYYCLNCGRRFYFYGIDAETMNRYDEDEYHLLCVMDIQVELLTDALDNTVKCCDNPCIIRQIG